MKFNFGRALTLYALAMTFPMSQAMADEIGLHDLGFMVGHWKGTGENAPEEVWLDPSDGVMAGMFRWPIANGSYVLELMSFIEEGGALVFRFKHFSPQIEAWEKHQPNTYRVIGVKDNCLSMQRVNDNPDVPYRIRYCRHDENSLEFIGATESESWKQAEFRLNFERLSGTGE